VKPPDTQWNYVYCSRPKLEEFNPNSLQDSFFVKINGTMTAGVKKKELQERRRAIKKTESKINKTSNVRIKVTLRRVRVTIVGVEKQ
jgi:hypothetical protein